MPGRGFKAHPFQDTTDRQLETSWYNLFGLKKLISKPLTFLLLIKFLATRARRTGRNLTLIF